jgi:cyclohexanone monooxygenase
VERITEHGVVVDGKEYEVDCLIFATGFEVGTGYTRRAGYDVIGRGGVKLSDKWADGPRTYHGFYTTGFPNCFFMGVIQSGFTANFPHMLNEQSLQIAYVVDKAHERQARRVEPTQQAEDEWVATIRRLMVNNTAFLKECTPGYYNNEGNPGGNNSLLGSQYGGGPEEFFRIMRDWRAEGSMAGLEIV